jgi:hypothetical protein
MTPASAPRRRPTLSGWAGNLLLLGGSVLAVMVILEAGARVIVARRPLVTSGEQGVYSQADPVLGWRNRPLTSVRYQRRDYQTHVAINSLGFRDVERNTAKAPGFGRVLALGDSFIEAYTVELEDSVTRRAEALSESEGCRLDVINAGVHGYSTDQEALWFLREAEPLAPDAVLLFFYYNDILNNIRSNYWGSPKPLTRIVNGQLTATNLPLPGPSHTQETRGVQTRIPQKHQGSVFKALLSERIVMGAPALHNRLAQLGLWEPIEPEALPDELRAYKVRGQLSEFDEAWDRTLEILRSLGEVIRARHAVPVLVHIPARFEISERDWQLTLLRYGINEKVWDRTLVSRRLAEAASQTGWTFFDLTAALRAATSSMGDEPYLRYDGHWNRLGHDTAARAVVGFLRGRKLLPCGGLPPLGASSPEPGALKSDRSGRSLHPDKTFPGGAFWLYSTG